MPDTSGLASLWPAAVNPLTWANSIRLQLNGLCKNLEGWQIIVYTCGATLICVSIKDFVFQEETLKSRLKKSFFSLARRLPAIRNNIEKELEKTSKRFEDSFQKAVCETDYLQCLPTKGLTKDALLQELKKYKDYGQVNWMDGWCSGMVYNGDPELTALLGKTYEMFAWSNPLHPEVFPGIRKMEAEVVRMCCTLFHGGPESCGTMTAGGTESILLACFAYRNKALENGIKNPEIIAPATIHAAFDKAALMFHMKLKHIPVDPKSKKVNVEAIKKALTKNTCLIVGSSPHFPHGITDPIREIAELGEKYGIPVHVDCCLGGFLVPFLEKAGFAQEPVDFRVPGVTSISADTHKYGLAPKGSSVILYSDKKYRKFQYFAQPDWPGGIYATPTIAGSRPGSEIAACWATLVYIGEDGYIESTKKIISTAQKIKRMLQEIQGIYVLGDPLLSVIAVGSDHFNIYRLCDELAEKGWNLNPLQFPPSFHLCVCLPHTKPGVAERFINDVELSVKYILQNPDNSSPGASVIYGTTQTIQDRSVVCEVTQIYLNASYDTNTNSKRKCISNILPNGTPA